MSDGPARPSRSKPGALNIITVCSASILAVELRIGLLFSSRWRENRKAALRLTHTPTDQLQPTTKSDKLSEEDYFREYKRLGPIAQLATSKSL
jgi:hypothetical protein